MSTRVAGERQPLEKECNSLQGDWLQAERNYHYITNANKVIEANLFKAQLEEKWMNGVEKMLPDFKCLHEFYENKLVQQENLAKQLRLEQRSLNESEPENLKQVCTVNSKPIHLILNNNPNTVMRTRDYTAPVFCFIETHLGVEDETL